MFEFLAERLSDADTALSLLVAVASIATIISLGMPLLDSNSLERRMKSVASERERIRARERDRMLAKNNSASLRHEPKAFMKAIVERFGLTNWLNTDQAKEQLAMAGYRGPQAEIAFLFFRLVSPIGALLTSTVYIFFILDLDYSFMMKLCIILTVTYIGLKAPEIFLKNTISKRQFSMRRAFPDAMDLLLICVESGMSIEHAFRRVSQEIGVQSIALAEEFTVTTAELAFLTDRRLAYENFHKRTGLDGVKQIVTCLVQAEKYGTALGAALRVVAQESRDGRLMEAEKKAASLPPKLTVPMIIFFLPVLFAIILTPAIVQATSK